MASETDKAPKAKNTPQKPLFDPLVPTIFHEPWWLNAVTGGDYRFVEVTENGRAIGRLPYFIRKRYGLTAYAQPPLTHFLGPAVDEGEGNTDKRFIKRMTVIQELLAQVPKADICCLKCHRDIQDSIAFQGENFHTSVQFTFEIAPQDEETVWKNLRAPRRTVIRGAQQQGVIVDVWDDPDAFIAFYEKNLDTKNKTSFVDLEACRQAVAAALVHNQGKIVAAKNPNGDIVAAVFYIWDQRAAYYLMTTRTPDAHNGAISLLVWEAIKDSMKRGLIFDLDGLFNKGGIMFLAGFGASISPRYIVTKASLPIWLLWQIKESFREGCYFN